MYSTEQAVPTRSTAEPEQVQVPSDLFSLGVILYEMLSGERPFKGKSASAICLQISFAEPEPLTTIRPSIDPGLAAICHQLLNKNPQRRFDSAQALADTLADWQNKRSLPATSAPTKPRHVGLVAVAAVVLIAAFAVSQLLQEQFSEAQATIDELLRGRFGSVSALSRIEAKTRRMPSRNLIWQPSNAEPAT